MENNELDVWVGNIDEINLEKKRKEFKELIGEGVCKKLIDEGMPEEYIVY